METISRLGLAFRQCKFLHRCPLLIIAALLWLGSCREAKKNDFADIFCQGLSQTIAEGHPNEGLAQIRAEKQAAGNDSDKYYLAMARESILDYYSGRPEALLAHNDSVVRWLNRHPSNAENNYLLGKMYSTKAGYYTRFVFNPDSNIHYYRKALERYQDYGKPEELANAYFNLGGAYKDNGNYDLSADYYGRAIQIADSASLCESCHIPLYIGLASSYTAMRDYEQSTIWWNTAESYWPHMTVDDRFHFLNNRGNDLFTQKRYPESLRYFTRLDSLLLKNPELEWERHFCQANLTDLYLRMGRTAEARRLMDSTRRYFTEVQPNTYVQSHIRTQELQLALAEKRYADIEKMFEQWENSGTEKRPEQVMERQEFMVDYYTVTHQWEKALQAQNRYSHYEDSLRNISLKLSASERQKRYERDTKVMMLNMDLKTHQKINFRNRVLIIAFIIVLGLLVTLVILMRAVARNREERMLHRILDLRIQSQRARINPHFIYNALNHELAVRASGAESSLDNLVRLLRRQQFMAEELSTTLAEDLDFIQDYVTVESQGLPSPVKFVKEIDPKLNPAKVTVPSMILQIFVENAFKHGFPSLPKDTERLLKIRVRDTHDAIKIEILNNAGDINTNPSLSTRQGLKIVQGTLRIFNERNCTPMTFDTGLWTDNPQHAGYRVTLIIPHGFNFAINGQ